MKVEFITHTGVNDGRQMRISESEFVKAVKDKDEFESFAFATNCLFGFYGLNDFIHKNEYDLIVNEVTKGCEIIVTIVPDGVPEVFISKNNRLKLVELP